jgi:phosphate:Na+ symporter
VQSSSAVTVATIGFVNAGLLTLRQALGVIFGTNVGTTMTGWLVSLVGFGFKIETFALPILTVGVALRVAAPGRRAKGLGEALAGFGLFFLGLALLKDAFGELAASFGAGVAEGRLGGGWLVFVLVGALATVLTQSSSAAIAILLTAAQGGVLELDAAAAAVIGANLGTTSTAALAVLKATPSAKRLALGHIVFNGLTGLVALALLPLLLRLVAWLGDGLDLEGSPAAILALFHTVFNVLGVALMLPFAGRMAALLERLFRVSEEDLGRPRHLDTTLVSTPALATAALHAELLRLEGIVVGLVRSALSGPSPAGDLARQSAAARALGEAVAEFVSVARTGEMPSDVAGELSGALFANRYLQEAAGLVASARGLAEETRRLPQGAPRIALEALLAAAEQCAARLENTPAGEAELERDLAALQRAYDAAKPELLGAAVAGQLTVQATDGLLDALRATRRTVRQVAKAARLLHGARMAEGPGEGNTDQPAAGTERTGEAREGAHS